MGYDKKIKEEVRKLRINGLSIDQIRKQTGFAKSTIHLWTKEITLSSEQKEEISIRAQKALQDGRLRSQKIKKEARIKLESLQLQKGIDEVGSLSLRELFLTGIALYWAEGFKNKHEHRLGFCNSDPSMIKFYLNWLRTCLGVKQKDLVARLAINDSYIDKTSGIEKHWSNIANIPLSQFTKTFYQHTPWKKRFDDDNYHGVLRIHVKNSLEYLLRMRGWIEGLRENMPG